MPRGTLLSARSAAIDPVIAEKLLAYGLPILVAFVFISATGIPTGVPIKLVLLAAGASLVGSLPGLAIAIATAAAAELAGTLALHGVARTGGVRLLDRVAAERQERALASFRRWRGRLGGHDAAAIAVLRLIPIVRYGVAIGAGLLGVRWRDFALGAAIAAVIWTSIPLSLGYAFRDRLEVIAGSYGSLLEALPLILGIVTLIVVCGALLKTPATRAWLRQTVAAVVRPFRARAASLPEVDQEAPPGIG